MGVGAIFVSTLAVTELPTPQSPPQDQAEALAATLQTIVSFVVLGSIIVRTSHPFSFPECREARPLTHLLARRWSLNPVLLVRAQRALADGLAVAHMDVAHHERPRLAAGGAPHTRRGHAARVPGDGRAGRRTGHG